MSKSFKRLLSLVMVVMMIVSMMPTTVFAAEADTADLTISTADGLKAFANEVNAGNSYEGKLVVLAKDIDLEYTAVVIGTKASPFKGTFDGQNHTVSNLTIYEDGSDSDYFADSDDCLGLFGAINTPAVIKNVTVHNPYIVGSSYIGAIVGMGYTGKIENCHVTGEIDIEGFYMVGGITGHGYARITDCSVIGEEGWDYNYIGATYKAANLEGDNVGGIVGHNAENNVISGCTVKNVTVSGTRKVGGIVGITAQSTDITDCKVEGVTVETTATAEYAAENTKTMSIGGIVGQYMANANGVGGTLSGCTVSGLTFANENGVAVNAGALTGGVRASSGITTEPADTNITVYGNATSDVDGNTVTYLVKEPIAIDLSQGAYTIETAGDYVVSAYEGANPLTIKADANVTLQGVNITAAADTSAISIESGNVTMNVAANSALTGGDNGAGIYVAEDAKLTVKGGKLTAVGNAGADDTSGAAGIGGTWANGNSGAITIDGATVVAKGYGVHGSGIGSGSGKVVGTISIINNANVTAQGGYYADGAGTLLQSSYGKSDPEGGAAIGGGGKTASTVAAITIADSTVVANGGSKAAGIGANFWCSVESITISGNSNVTAQGGSSSAGIGTSRAGDTGVSANITISGGTVKATGGAYGAGIGAGYNADSLGNGADASALPETSITISGGNVTAVGGEGGAGIGGGYKSDNIDVDITAGTVNATAGALVSGKTVANGGAPAAIGSGANGSGVFENSPQAEVGAAATVTVAAHAGGKNALEGYANEALPANVTLSVVGAVAKIGDTYYETLQAAINAAGEGETIILCDNITLTEGITVAADDVITLDLNGKTVSQTYVQTAGYQMILNDGNLTINDSVGGGKLSYTDSGNGGEYISDTIYNRGTLTINGGTIENLSSETVADNGYPHAVDNYSGIRDTALTVNGGTIYCAEYSAIRMFCVSATYKADLTINGGTIKGAVDMQNGTKNAALGSLTVNGGTFQTTANANNIRFANWNGGATEYGITASIEGGSFNGGITTAYVPAAANWNKKIITGGTFASDMTDFCADGFVCEANGDGSFGVGERALKGTGTAEAPFQINNLDDLKFFRDEVNGGKTYNGEYIKLTANVDLAGENWVPIGNTTNYFRGNFDGGNHTISNMTINANTPEADQFAGLFGGIKNGTVKNLTMKDVSITVVGKKVRAAAITGIASSDTTTPAVLALNFENITVDGCTITAEAKAGSAQAGGIAGYCYPANMKGITVSDLTIDGKAAGNTLYASAMAAYVCGQNISNNGNTRMAFTVEDFNLSNINIKAEAYSVLAGGYTGEPYYGYITFNNGIIDGIKMVVKAHEAFVGGLVGYFWRSDAGHKVNNVNITGIDFDVTTDYLGETRIGGMVGTSQSVVDYKDCSVAGTITERCSDSENPVNYHAKVGGFVGRAYTWKQTYENCTADVDVTGSHVAGGFIGNHITNASYTNCEAKGDVTATIAGGFAGRLTENGFSTAVTFDSCSASGNVEGTKTAGGFIGSTADYGWGGTTGNPYAKNITLKDCEASSSVTGSGAVAGVVGELLLKDGIGLVMDEVDYAVKPAYLPEDANVTVYVAQIGDTKYTTLAEALAAVTDGTTLTIFEGTYDAALVINKSNVTVIGEGNVTLNGVPSLKGTNYKVENIDFVYATGSGNLSGSGLIKDCSFTATAADGNTFRYCYGTKDAAITFEGCTLTAPKWAVHFDSAPGLDLTFTDCQIDGRVALGGDLGSLTATGTTFENGYVNVWGTEDAATFTGCEFVDIPYVFTGYDADNTVKFNSCSATVDGSDKAVTDMVWGGIDSADALIYVDDVLKTGAAKIGDTHYATLSEAINAGGAITVLRDVTEEIQIVDGTEAVVDMNGKTLNGCFKPFEGKLTLSNGAIVNTNASCSAIEINAGELVLTDVDVTSTRHAVRIDGAVTATINGGNYGVNATSGTRHAVNVSGAANVTIKAGTFVGPKGTTMDSGAAVNVQSGATVTIEGGNFSKGKNNTLGVSGTLTVKGGIFDQNPAAYVAEGYVYTVKADGTFGVYETLQEAVNASVAGDTVVLTGNVELTESLTVAPMATTYALNAEQGITLDLNGKTITSDVSTIVVDGGELTVKDSGTTGKIITTDATGDYEAITVKNGGKLTLTGGTVESGKYGIYAYTSGGTVVMTGGTVKAPYMAIAIGGGSVAISGGTLICDSYIVYDWDKDLITITGGTFSMLPDAAYIAYGYGTKEVSVDNATYYQVTAIDPVAYIGEVGYYTIDAAIKAAQDGDTIIVNTCTVNGDVSVNKDITLQAAEGATVTINGDLNITADGATVKGLTVVSGGTALYINAKDVLVEACDITGAWSGMYQSYTTGKVTFKDSKITGKGAYAIHFDGSAGGEIVIDNCELSGWTSLAASIKNVTVTDTKFVENDANNYVRFYQENVVIDGCTFNEKMNVDLAVDNATVTVTDSTVDNGNVEDLFGDADIVNSTITVDGVKLARAAKIGDTYYKTIADAIAAANEGDTVTILAGDYTTDIAVKSGITVVGQTDAEGNNLVNITGRVSASTGATVMNLNVHNDKTGDYDCALVVNGNNIVIDGVKLTGYNAMRYCYANGDITVKNSTINGSNFAVHFDGSAGGNVAFENCDITGWCSYASTVNSVSYTECSIDQGGYAGHRYYNKNVTFNECDFAEDFQIDLKASGSNVAITDADMTMAEAKALFKDPYYVAKGNITLNNEKLAYVASAYTANGSKYFDSLQDAINEVNNGGYITVRSDIVLTAPVTVPAGKSVEIGLGDYNITYISDVMGEAMITNNGELTISGNGKVVYTYTGAADSNYGKGNYTIANNGKLTVDGVTIENATAEMKHASYAITNGNGGEIILEDGLIQNTNNYAVRMFGEGSMTVNGGEVTGTRAVWMQAPGSDTAAAPEISLTVNDGKLTATGENGGYKLAVYSYTYGNSLENVSIAVNGGELDGDIALSGGSNKTVAETVTITGGTIANLYSYAADEVAAETINVSGGTFKNAVAEAYCADGYIPKDNGDGTYGVKEGTYVAQVGSTKYESLADALAAANEGDTVMLLSDITPTAQISITKSLTLDLNGKTITGTGAVYRPVKVSGGNSDIAVKITNGTIKTEDVTTKPDQAAALLVYDGADVTLENVKLDGSYYGVIVAGYYYSEGSNVERNNVTSVIADSGTEIKAVNAALIAQGAYPNSYLEINDGAVITSTDSVAIYYPHAGHVVVNGGTVTGENGIVIKAGKLTVNGGTISAVGAVADHEFKPSGAAITGDAIVIESLNYGGYGAPEVSIAGGTITSANGKAVVSYADTGYEKVTGFVSGGMFNTPVAEEYCADGYIPKDNGDGTYGVKVGKYAARNTTTGVGYETFAAAYAAAQAGETIELLEDVKLTDKLTIAKAITIDGNGHSIIADETAVWYTVSGKFNIKSYKTHLLGINASNITLKDVVLDCNDNAAGINIYCAQDVVFDNVSIINATKGNAGLTVNGSTLTARNALTITGHSMPIDMSNGSGVTSALGMTIEQGTVTNLDNKTVRFSSAASTDLTGAVDANGDPYFAAKDNAYYYTQAQMDSRTAGYSNGLTLLDDVTLSRDATISGTLNLNGHDLTVADGKVVKVTGNLTVTGEGDFNGEIALASANATVTAPAGIDVTTTVADCRVVYENGVYKLAQIVYVAQVGNVKYETLADALTAATDGDTVELLWTEGNAPIAMNGAVFGKTVTITGTATVDWSKGNLFVGRGGEGNGTVIFDGANLTSASNSASYGIHVSGREKNTSNKYDGTLVIKNSTIELDYLINRGAIEIDNSNLTVKRGFGIAGRPATETESGEAATATIDIKNGSYVKVLNHNGMGIGVASAIKEGYGILNLTDSTFECENFNVDADMGAFNVSGASTVKIAALSGKRINIADGATLTDSTIGGSINMLGDLTIDGGLTLTGGLWASNGGTLSGDKLTAYYAMFQTGDYVISADMDLDYGYLSFNGTFQVNSEIYTKGTSGEVLYIRGNVTLNDGAVLDADGGIFLDNENAVLTIKPNATVDGNVNVATEGVQINIDVTGMTAGVYQNITGTISNGTNATINVLGNEDMVAELVSGKIILKEKFYAAQIGNVKYETLQEALTVAAVSGGEVTLLNDYTEEGMINVMPGVTLNLNGKVLTAKSYVMAMFGSSNIIDSTKGEGALKVDEAKLFLMKSNEMLPVRIAAGEIHFTTLQIGTLPLKTTDLADGVNCKIEFIIHQSGTAAFLKEQLASKTMKDLGLGLRVSVKCTQNGDDRVFYFYLNQEHMDGYVGNWGNSQFYMFLSGLDNMENVDIRAEMVFGVDTGAEVVAQGSLREYN